MNLITKFRAFQLETDGSLFSNYKNNVYTLIEARLPKGGLESLVDDLEIHSKQKIDVLHITSWDNDHCNYDDLIEILNQLRPEKIEIPSYLPESDMGKLCRKTISGYDRIHQERVINVQMIDQKFIRGLSQAREKSTNNILYEGDYLSLKKNDWSLIKLFRSLGFNVLSLGDCESSIVSDRLKKSSILCEELDVLILPHHGADNGFITGEFLDAVKPKIAICSSNNCNQYDHPRQNIRNLLSARGIPLMTTKRGDVIVGQFESQNFAEAYSYQGDNYEVHKQVRFNPKRYLSN